MLNLGVKEAVVKNPRKDTVSREVLRYPELADKVRLSRVRNHFICKLVDLHVNNELMWNRLGRSPPR